MCCNCKLTTPRLSLEQPLGLKNKRASVYMNITNSPGASHKLEPPAHTPPRPHTRHIIIDSYVIRYSMFACMFPPLAGERGGAERGGDGCPAPPPRVSQDFPMTLDTR